MSVMIIGTVEQAAITAALTRARAHPTPLAWIVANKAPDQGPTHVTVANRPKNFNPCKIQELVIPRDYRLAISYEEQPDGLCLHISMSLLQRAQTALPHPHAVAMVAKACGIPLELDENDNLKPNDRIMIWIEDFLDYGRPGGSAINVLYVVEPSQPKGSLQ